MGMGDKATEEVAKLGQRSLETADKLGNWVDGIIGDGLRHLGGTFADSMAGFRLKNRLRVLAQAQKLVDDAGLSGNTRALTHRIGVPLVEAIEQEDNETLQGVWATYIRNAVDPDQPEPDRILIEVIRSLEPADWPILQKVFSKERGDLDAGSFEVPEEELRFALDRMETLRLFDYDDDTIPFLIAGSFAHHRVVVHIGKSKYIATRLLRRLNEATSER